MATGEGARPTSLDNSDAVFEAPVRTFIAPQPLEICLVDDETREHVIGRP